MTIEWRKYTLGQYTGVDWRHWLNSDKPIDPYLVWADLCGDAGYAKPEPSDPDASWKWPFIIELSEPDLLIRVAVGETAKPGAVELFFGSLTIAQTYVSGSPAGRWKIDGKYITALAFPSTVEKLLTSDKIIRFQLGLPRIPKYQTGATPGRAGADFLKIPKVIVGIIDDGCAFAHPDFQNSAGQTRVRYLWDQDERRHKDSYGWTEVQELGYGAELRSAALQQAAALGLNNDFLPYKCTHYGHFKLDPETTSSQALGGDGLILPAATQTTGSHGTSVMALAAGYPPVLRAQDAPLPTGDCARPRSPEDLCKLNLPHSISALAQQAKSTLPARQALAITDTADQWDMVFVQLPTRTVADTSGGSLAVHALDAVRYIQDRAQQIPYESDDRDAVGRDYVDNAVIINLSWGALAGGHDGTSILELGLAERAAVKKPKTTVVVAAGNAHRAGHHVAIEIARGETRNLRWTIGPDNPLESYLEIWLPDQDSAGNAISDSLFRELMWQITLPDGQRLVAGVLGQAWIADQGKKNMLPDSPVAALIFARHVVQSNCGTMVLLAASPTRPRRVAGMGTAPHGQWMIELIWRPDTAGATGTAMPVQIHGWCERNDLTFGAPRRQQSKVQADDSARDFLEFSPEVMADLRRGPYALAGSRSPSQRVSNLSLSSISRGMPQAPSGGLGAQEAATNQNKAGPVVVGAYRLADEEVSQDSSGGPGRLFATKNIWKMLFEPPPSGIGQVAPDYDAPADMSPANPGLRTPGILSNANVRFNGSSAAAATVTRAFANCHYWNLPGRKNSEVAYMVKSLLLTAGAELEFAGNSRHTPTPRADDAFRKGRVRAR